MTQGESDVDSILQQLQTGMVAGVAAGGAQDRVKDAVQVVQERAKLLKSIEKKEESSKDIRAQIAEMSFPDKLKLAMLGDSVARSILVYDSNSMIAEAVLGNPRITQGEVEDFAKNPNTPDNILREISKNREWMRSYQLQKSLVFNPKTPMGVSMALVKRLLISDLRQIARSKNIPQGVASNARRMLMAKQKK